MDGEEGAAVGRDAIVFGRVQRTVVRDEARTLTLTANPKCFADEPPLQPPLFDNNIQSRSYFGKLTGTAISRLSKY